MKFKPRYFALSCVVLAGYGVPAFPEIISGSNGIAITNLTAGVVCGPDNNRRICFQTDDIQITGEGTCIYNGKKEPCTWYGYSFDYSLPKETKSIELDCNWQSDIRADWGNPKSEIAKNVANANYKIDLQNDKRHFFNPQYAAQTTNVGLGNVQHVKQSCSYMGRMLFEIEFRLHFPER